ncbi:MAG: hypothetical protein GY845_25615 [Planctomycetes bacterium]|nr:hypothetical protein [Planctomycetota bacterium]
MSKRIKFFLRYVDNIQLFIRDLGIKLTWQQQQFVDAYAAGDANIAVRSGKGPGKTFVTALVALHWLLTNPRSRMIVTAPTFRQCKKVWLAQAEKLMMLPGIPKIFKEVFKFQGEGVSVMGNKVYIWGCYLVTARSSEAFQGIHDKYLFILEEESSGVIPEISQAILDTLSNPKGSYRHVRIGNPNTRNCAFYNSFYRDTANKWTKIRWNAEETPESEYFSERRNIELAEEFGEDSDVYRVAVLGEFPEKDANCLIDEDLLTACYTPEAEARANSLDYETVDFTKQIGIDLARNGDRNAIVARCGHSVRRAWSGKVEPIECLDKAIMFQHELGWTDEETMFVMDAAGMGEGLVYLMSHAQQRKKQLHQFYTQNKAHESDKYDNKMTEAWCNLNKMIRRGEVYLGKKIDNRLLVQLVSRQFIITEKSRIQIESKKVYIKRMADVDNGGLGKSPDEADALVMAFYPHTQSVGAVIG